MQLSELPSVYARLWSKVQDSLSEGDTSVLVQSGDDPLDFVLGGDYAYISDSTSVEGYMSENCELAVLQEKFFPTYYAFAVQNNSVYRQIFDEM